MIPDEEISYFKSRLTDYLYLQHGITNLKKHFHCLNPNHVDNNPSMSYFPKRNICKCFSCLERYDIYDLVEIDFGIKNFREKHNKLAEIFNEKNRVVSLPPLIKEDNYIIKNYSRYFNYCFHKISHSNYLSTRGISDRLLIKYKIGYDENRNLIIFPLNDHSYFGRSTISKGKYKSSGIGYLFNENLIKYSNKNSIVYVTESIIDSLSLETVIPEIETVSLNGNLNINRLISLCKDYDYKGIFILALDNDRAGLDAQNLLKNEFDKLNIPSFPNTLISSIGDGNLKDINEALIKNKTQLVKNLHYFYQQYQIISEKVNEKRGVEIEKQLE